MRGIVALAALLAALAAGGSTRASTTFDHADPTWSPDGTTIAFALESGQGGAVAAVGANGAGERRLFGLRDSCCGPVLWAAGDRIAFISDYRLFAAPATGGAPRTLFTGTPWFVLSPNRETAAVEDGCGCGHAPDAIAFVNLRGGPAVVVEKPQNATDSIEGFSPDGTQLVFARRRFDPNGGPVPPPALLAVRVDTRRPVPLSQSGLVGAQRVPSGAEQVQWSPDGRWIAYTGAGGLHVVPTRGGRPRAIATVRYSSFAWSPTSKQIAYTTGVARGRLAVSDVAGHRRVLWTNPSLHYLTNNSLNRPQWSPDGTSLVFMAVVGPGRPPAHIWVVGADGAGLKQVD